MKLESIVPWGRSFEEYRSFFNLAETDLQKRILGCGDGPANFNAVLTQQGGNIISVDPIYEFTADQIRSRIDEVYAQIMSQVEHNRDNYIWGIIKNVAELGKVRMHAMNQFLSDYDAGLQFGRYISASLSSLPFTDHQFELALCSHFLFLYSEHLNLDQHILSMMELCRIAEEVRVYPLISLDGFESMHLSTVIKALDKGGIHVALQTVDYQFQKGATSMLVAREK